MSSVPTTNTSIHHAADDPSQIGDEAIRLLELLPDLFCLSSASGELQILSPAWYHILGYRPEELLHIKLQSLVHPEDRHFFDAWWATLAGTSSTQLRYGDFECRMLHKDGGMRDLHWDARALPDAGKIYAHGRDITRHKHEEHVLATRALKQSALASFGRFALDEHSFQELAGEAVHIILETLHVECAVILAVKQETRELTYMAGACRIGRQFPKSFGQATPAAMELSAPLQLATDVKNFPGAEVFLGGGIRSAMVCPMGTGRQLFGYIYANTQQQRDFSPEAVDFINGLANILYTVKQRELAEKALAENEQKLLQSQKFEAVGLLASGIAHDFNNLLTAIRCHAAMVKEQLLAAEIAGMRSHVDEILKTTDRATGLTRRLISFSRAQPVNLERVDLNHVVTENKNLVTSFLSRAIALDIRLAETPVVVRFDHTQLEQVILNLAINARDAMPDGGRLVIATAIATVPAGLPANTVSASSEPFPAGTYAQLTITDTGTGIPKDVQPKIFTPFMTTKPKGFGTGLGLASCATIVKNANGDIRFESTPGEGTQFTVLLPLATGDDDVVAASSQMGMRSAKQQDNTPTSTSFQPLGVYHDLPHTAPALEDPDMGELPRGSEPVMLIEDDDSIREVTTAILESLGYRVRAFGNAASLLAFCASPMATEVKLLISDIVMPDMGGRQLAERVRAILPELRILFMSGYIDDTALINDIFFMEKPFTRATLAVKVRHALDAVLPARQ